MGGYKQSNKMIYLAILEQGVGEKIEPRLRDLGSRMLKTTVMNLPPEFREEEWVTQAVYWLGRLEIKRADPLLNTILKEKKWFFWPVWPAECRQAAKEILAAQQENLQSAPDDETAKADDDDPDTRQGEDDPIDEREDSVDEIQ
jgi:hypothetical protein